MKCYVCGTEQPSKYYFKEPGICLECHKKYTPEELEEIKRKINYEDTNFLKIIITTSHSIDGYKIDKYIDVITSECVFGINIFKDFLADIRDIFGGRSESVQKILREARELCLMELKKEAYKKKADAVIGIDLDYHEFSGGGKSMLFLVASGTAVKISAIKSIDNNN